MGLGVAIAVGTTVDAELAEASSLEVHERIGSATAYFIRYPVNVDAGDLPRLLDDRLAPGKDLAVLVAAGGVSHCLVKGPVRGHQLHLQHGGDGSWLEVSGADSSIRMDRETRIVQWSDVTDSDAVLSILGTYGLIPEVETTNAGHFEDKHTLMQHDTDLNFVRRLARRNGFVFWVRADAALVETAYFQPIKPDSSALAAELIINLPDANLDSIDLQWDVERPTSVIAAQLDLNNKESIDGSLDEAMSTFDGDVPLAEITGDARSVSVITPVDDSGDLLARSTGALTEAAWFLRATCATTVAKAGKLIRAHDVINLRGAGSRYSGLYLVESVRHIIDAVEHKMEITLIRSGWREGSSGPGIS